MSASDLATAERDRLDQADGDNGAGLGAWHQTGWTALVADLILTLRRP